MHQFAEPPACLIRQPTGDPKPFPLIAYLAEVILPLPYWRSSDEAASEAEEIFEAIDRIESKELGVYILRDGTVESLKTQMKLAESMFIQANPRLARASLRYLRVVFAARKYIEPLPAGSSVDAPLQTDQAEPGNSESKGTP